MSKSARRVLSLLLVVSGTVVLLNRNFKDEDNEDLIGEASASIAKAVLNWPGARDKTTNTDYVVAKIRAWEKSILKLDWVREDDDFAMITLLHISINILTDLLDGPITNKIRAGWLQGTLDSFSAIADLVDNNRAAFAHYEKADELLERLYKIVDED